VGQDLLIVEASRSHSDTPHSVELLSTSDQSDAETHALDSAATGISTASAATAAATTTTTTITAATTSTTTTTTAAATTTTAAAAATTTTTTTTATSTAAAAAAAATTTTHSFILISYDRSIPSSKASSSQNAI
jgi:hypothetical protein